MCANRNAIKEDELNRNYADGRLAFYLKELRTQCGLSRAKVSKRIGKTELTIYKWEKGITEPAPSVLAKLLDYYGYMLGTNISIDQCLGR